MTDIPLNLKKNSLNLINQLKNELSIKKSDQELCEYAIQQLEQLKKQTLLDVESHFDNLINQVKASVTNSFSISDKFYNQLQDKLNQYQFIYEEIEKNELNSQLYNQTEYINYNEQQISQQILLDSVKVNTSLLRFNNLQKELSHLINFDQYKNQIDRDYKIHSNIIETIGNTPLVRLNKVPQQHEAVAEIILKLEFFNPLSSVKDRIGFNMVHDLLKQGKINRDTILIEPTSGNTGIGLAFVASALGLKLILVMPETMSIERRKLFKILGAKLVLSPGPKGMIGSINMAKELQEQISNSIIVGQFDNPSNPEIHRQTTAQEIWRDTNGQVDILVAGIGTGGTITGIGEILKSKNPDIKIVAVEPDTSPVLSGGKPGPHKIQGIGAGFIPNILNTQIYDEIIQVNHELSGPITYEINTQEGIPIGLSSGAIAYAALQLAKRPENKGKKIVAIMPSSCERYLSTWLFDQINTESEEIEVKKQFCNQ